MIVPYRKLYCTVILDVSDINARCEILQQYRRILLDAEFIDDNTQKQRADFEEFLSLRTNM